MNNEIEFGYTPNNLKSLRARYGLTQAQVASITGVMSWRSVARWEADVADENYSSMPHQKWVSLLNVLKSHP